MSIDIHSVLFVHSIINLLTLIVTIVVWKNNKARYKATFFWMLSMALAALGELLIFLRDIVPDIFSIVIGNTLLIIGLAVFKYGLWMFVKGTKPPPPNIILLILFVVGFVYYGLVDSLIAARYIIFSLAVILINAQNIAILLKPMHKQFKNTYLAMAALFSLYGIIHLVRILTTIIWPPDNFNLLQTPTIEAIYLILSQLIFLIVALSIVGMVNMRLMAELKTTADDNAVLLQEINHRVKNNLQMIISLIRMQGRNLKNPSLKHTMLNLENRVHSMSIVYEQLVKKEDAAELSVREYISEIVNGLKNGISDTEQKITFILLLDEFQLPAKKTVPLGLILNELITNCYEHAFPDRANGTITITFTRQNNEYSLKIKDNGVGFTDEFNYRNTVTMGGRLLRALSRQLHGEITHTSARGEGSTFFLTFPEDNQES